MLYINILVLNAHFFGTINIILNILCLNAIQNTTKCKFQISTNAEIKLHIKISFYINLILIADFAKIIKINSKKREFDIEA